MELQLRLAGQAKLEQKLNARLVVFYRLLQLNSLELQQAVHQEILDNPALEAVEHDTRCPLCGAELAGARCQACGYQGREAALSREDELYCSAANDPDEEYDQFARLPAQFSLKDHLKCQVRIVAPKELWLSADALIEQLDDEGYYRGDLAVLAAERETTEEHLEAALAAIQQCDPPGAGARNLRQCLSIQLRQMDSPEAQRALLLVQKGWDRLARGDTENLGRLLKLTDEEVEAAVTFIREELNPYPARAFHPPWGDQQEPESLVAPEVVILEADGDYSVEVLTSRAFGLRLSPTYVRAYTNLQRARGQEAEHVRGYLDRARLFIASLNRRTRTLHNVALAIVGEQKPFLKLGAEFLRPITRKALAERINMHESTVSRCVSGKHALLPKGDIIGFELFFDRAAPIKTAIESLVKEEPKAQPYTDDKIGVLLKERFGLEFSRRTVAKHRLLLGIPDRATRRSMYKRNSD